MKKVLFATTALVMTAGIASAEVAVSGDARLGMRYESDTDYIGDSSWNVVNRARVKFKMTGESQSGITFGASLRADQKANGGGNNSATSGTVWVSGAYGKLTVGDIDGALESAVGDLPEVGVTGLDYHNEFAYATSEESDDAGLIYEYSFGNANIYASFNDQYEGNSDQERDSNSYALGVGYDLGGYTFGIGYEKADYTINPFVIDEHGGGVSVPAGEFTQPDDSDTWGISGGTSVGGVTFKAVYLKTNSDNDLYDYAQYGLGASYEMSNGVGISAFWRKNDFKNIPVEGDAIGIGASYDLGGGATLKAGIVDSSLDALGVNYDNTLADVGLSFNF